MDYTLLEDKGIVVNNTTKCHIPIDVNNSQYVEYLRWVDEGNTPLTVGDTPTWDDIRSRRDIMLKQCDWVMCVDSPMNGDQDWLDYRQALRNLPQAFKNPEDVVWPEKP